jgi:transposase
MICLEQEIGKNAEVRLIDAFIDWLPLQEMRFINKGKSKEGRPAYQTSDLLKLYIYGYLNRVRSSRQLEKHCSINIEIQWLLKGLQPCHQTINTFRKNNARPLLKVFRKFNRFLRVEGAFDEDTVAIDGSKFRAQNSKKNNFNEKKINDHLNHIDKQTKAYLKELEENDCSEISDSTEENRLLIAQKLEHLNQRRNKYQALEKDLKVAHEKGITQISTTDPDARALPKKMNIVEVAYNVVTSVEAKNKLITNFEVTNKHDTYALSLAARKAKKALGKTGNESIKVLADKGFDTGAELKSCIQNNIETYVAPKKRVNALKGKRFNKSKFEYDHEQDLYTCPKGEILRSNGKSYRKNNGKLRKSYRVKHYKTAFSVCNNCEHRLACAGLSNLNNSKGRYIERNEYEDYIEENIERVRLNKPLYRQRQAVVEHPFGTIKRQWGFDYTLLKTMPKVRGEFALIFTAYNLRRAISIFGVELLLEKLKGSLFYVKSRFSAFSKPFLARFFEAEKVLILVFS